jgi:uncharacterized protein YjiS (DUF1127 family)
MTSATYSKRWHRPSAEIFAGSALRRGLRELIKLGSGTLAHASEQRRFWRLRRTEIRRLHALDNQLLADLGLSRDDIPGVVDLALCRELAGARPPFYLMRLSNGQFALERTGDH